MMREGPLPPRRISEEPAQRVASAKTTAARESPRTDRIAIRLALHQRPTLTSTGPAMEATTTITTEWCHITTLATPTIDTTPTGTIHTPSTQAAITPTTPDMVHIRRAPSKLLVNGESPRTSASINTPVSMHKDALERAIRLMLECPAAEVLEVLEEPSVDSAAVESSELLCGSCAADPSHNNRPL